MQGAKAQTKQKLGNKAAGCISTQHAKNKIWNSTENRKVRHEERAFLANISNLAMFSKNMRKDTTHWNSWQHLDILNSFKHRMNSRCKTDSNKDALLQQSYFYLLLINKKIYVLF